MPASVSMQPDLAKGAGSLVYYAHSGNSDDKSDWQTMSDHAFAVAHLAAEFATPFGLEKAARLAGLFHDLGKYNPAFQRRLEGAKQSVDHSTAGAVTLMARANGLDRWMLELIAYCILGHHAGLPDKMPEQGASNPNASFKQRFEHFRDALDPVWKTEIDGDLSGVMADHISALIRRGGAHAKFDLSVVARFLFSCLVDADFKDTERFYTRLEGRKPDRDWPSLRSLLSDYRARFDGYMAAKPTEGEVNRLRREILARVRSKASIPPGLFTLTVPTGGGKTLATLGFALDHAGANENLRRIIYAIPFTSIVDQTADIFRDVLGGEHILEHHSAIEEEREGGRERLTSRDRLKLAMEDWAAPVVVTTNVQFFESLFAARTSRARKLHNIAGSIIILDEAQTLPRHLLKPAVRMLDTLARLFGCTVLLCTATQPALGKTRPDGGQGFPDGLDLEGRELAPDPEGLSQKLRRCRVEQAGAMDDAALIGALRAERQALVIVNSRKHALDLYKAAKEAGLDGLIHLTTRQCAAHRRKILKDVRHRLDAQVNEPCRVIATSLIEAGVDVDFPKVWRAQAGWDQVMQAAGRCNREGRRDKETSIVTVFSAPDNPPPREIKSLVEDTVRALKAYSGDVRSLDAIRSFFEEVYWRLDERLDGKDSATAILPRLNVSSQGTDFAFRSIAADFRMIDSTMEPVIIPLDDTAKKAVDELAVEQIPSGAIARKLQSYVVQVPPRARQLLLHAGHVAFAHPEFREKQFAVLRKGSLYSRELGLLWEENEEYLAVEDTIV